jgi:hypothetical protein
MTSLTEAAEMSTPDTGTAETEAAPQEVAYGSKVTLCPGPVGSVGCRHP